MEGRILTTKIDADFVILKNPGDGNCLFYALSQLLYGTITQHQMVRRRIYDFYKTFSMKKKYRQDTLNYRLQMELMFNEEHCEKLCNLEANTEWGISADITAACLVYKTNIIVFNQFLENPSEYIVAPITSSSYRRTMYLKYNTLNTDEEHYEAMIPTVMSSPPPPSKKKCKKN
jgi:uncharacterized Rmd1/YagE family protein